jgi:hypothetical protein
MLLLLWWWWTRMGAGAVLRRQAKRALSWDASSLWSPEYAMTLD